MEIEAKFSIRSKKIFRRLLKTDQLADYSLAADRVEEIHDTYLDTGDRHLLSAGYVCRHRMREQSSLMTIKELKTSQADAIHRREEWEVQLSETLPPDRWPDSPARDRVLQLIGDQALAPLVDLQQTRTVRQLTQADRLVAEVYLDRVHVAANPGSLEFMELECELQPLGTEADLLAITAYLEAEWKLKPELRSKFERAFEFVNSPGPVAETNLLSTDERAVLATLAEQETAPAQRARALLALDAGATVEEAAQRSGLQTARVKYWRSSFQHRHLAIFPKRVLGLPPEIDSTIKTEAADRAGLTLDDPMAEAARKTLKFHFEQMLKHETGTRDGSDIEELHDMRVATRRMRAALQLFDRYLDRAAIKPYAKGLRRTGRALGAVRDLDVFQEKVRTYLDRLPVERRDELRDLLAAWQREHDRARANLLKYLDSDEYNHFKTSFGEFLQTPGAGAAPIFSAEDEPLPYRVRHVVPRILFEGYAQVRAFTEWLTASDLTRYHQLRIASKELRYTLEFFREVFGPQAKALIKNVKQLQDHLGNLQDASVACDIMRNFLMWGTWQPGQSARKQPSIQTVVNPGVALYLSARQAEIQTLVNGFALVWSPLTSEDFVRSLAKLVADISVG
jgi:CHAD domain-containing protein